MTQKVPSVFVSLPAYDTMQVPTCLSLVKLFNKFTLAKIKAEIGTFKCPYVSYGRNVLTDNGEVFVNHYVDSSSGGSTVEYNFGSGFFGTTAVASANADANGHGAFEYSVPSGYYTLNTKNVKEFG